MGSFDLQEILKVKEVYPGLILAQVTVEACRLIDTEGSNKRLFVSEAVESELTTCYSSVSNLYLAKLQETEEENLVAKFRDIPIYRVVESDEIYPYLSGFKILPYYEVELQ